MGVCECYSSAESLWLLNTLTNRAKMVLKYMIIALTLHTLEGSAHDENTQVISSHMEVV